jgi:hypothetical protein
MKYDSVETFQSEPFVSFIIPNNIVIGLQAVKTFYRCLSSDAY